MLVLGEKKEEGIAMCHPHMAAFFTLWQWQRQQKLSIQTAQETLKSKTNNGSEENISTIFF